MSDRYCIKKVDGDTKQYLMSHGERPWFSNLSDIVWGTLHALSEEDLNIIVLSKDKAEHLLNELNTTKREDATHTYTIVQYEN